MQNVSWDGTVLYNGDNANEAFMAAATRMDEAEKRRESGVLIWTLNGKTGQIFEYRNGEDVTK
jgi:hypothetical protein